MTDSPLLCACGCWKPVKVPKYPSQYHPRFVNGHQHKGPNNGNWRGGKEKRACPVCGETFYVFPSSNHVTCAKDSCYRQWQRLTTSARGQNKIMVLCDHCGRPIRRYPSQIIGNRYHFCNRFCAEHHHSILFSAEQNGRWSGGKLSYQQAQARIRDNYSCVICGFNLSTDVHHITPKAQGGTDDFSNLITLCPNHHRLANLNIISVEHLRNPTWQPAFTALLDSANHSHTE